MVVAELGDSLDGSARPELARGIGGEYVPDSLAEGKLQALSFTLPARLPLRIGRLDVGNLPFPVDVLYDPRSTPEKEDPGPVLLSQEGQLVDEPELLPAMQDREQRRREENREELEEVLPAEDLLAFRSERKQAAVAEEDLLLDHPAHDRASRLSGHPREAGASF